MFVWNNLQPGAPGYILLQTGFLEPMQCFQDTGRFHVEILIYYFP